MPSTLAPHRSDAREPLLDALLGRRSIAQLTAPGPTPEQLDLLLQAATTVPDHGAVRPWRFVVVTGEARHRFGDALAAAGRHERPDLPEVLIDKLRRKPLAAPTQIVVISAPDTSSKVPVWEQECSASCTGFALALAAHALGLGAVWKSTTMRGGDELRSLLALGPDDAVLGWVNVGTPADGPGPRSPLRPEPGEVTAVLTDGGLLPYVPGAPSA